MARSGWSWRICQRDNYRNSHPTLPCAVADSDNSTIRKKGPGERVRGLDRDGSRKLFPHVAAIRSGYRLSRWNDADQGFSGSALANVAFRAERQPGHRTRAFCAVWAIGAGLTLEIGRRSWEKG